MSRTPWLALGALGVVFGDIGTSPLYAMQVALGIGGVNPTQDDVLGLLSLFLWVLVIVVCVKYLGVVLRADNRGEGGELALAARVRSLVGPRGARWALIVGIVGVGLFYADGAITPAVSVLAASEGITVPFPGLEWLVLPLALGIIVALFLLQRLGTERVGRVFGPIMLVWFAVMALLGGIEVVREPGVLAALNPVLGVGFLLDHTGIALAVLGAVVLCVTGVEALYVDMGHFGRQPIALAWFCVALPAITLSYLGQGALVIEKPATADNPFFNLGPSWAAVPLLVLAGAATVIASQAVISGVFSATRQAIRLDLLPRQRVVHTSEEMEGQIYMPLPTWTLFVAVVALMLAFGSSQALAGAYGIAVTATMVICTAMVAVVARRAWRWPVWRVGMVFAGLMLVDLLLLSGTLMKLPQGGWVAVAAAVLLIALMITWQKGRALLRQRLRRDARPLAEVLADVPADDPRLPGVSVFMSSDPRVAPRSLVTHLRQIGRLHEHVLLVSVKFREVPRVSGNRAELVEVAPGVHAVTLRYGYMEQPDIPLALIDPWWLLALPGGPQQATYIIGDDDLVVSRTMGGMPYAQKRAFAFLYRNAARAADFFNLPSDQVVHLGTEVAV